MTERIIADDQRPNPAKVFVGGLGQQTTDYSLQAYFSQFGTVEDAVVVSDKLSGRSRGFGFCTFATTIAAEKCLEARHKIDGVSCEVRRAVPREEARGSAPYDTVSQPAKAFVGGLTDDITEDKLRRYFEKFGRVKESTLMYDKNSHRPRGFGFIVFEQSDDVDKAVGPHPGLGRGCEVKRAEPRPDSRSVRGRAGGGHESDLHSGSFRGGSYYEDGYRGARPRDPWQGGGSSAAYSTGLPSVGYGGHPEAPRDYGPPYHGSHRGISARRGDDRGYYNGQPPHSAVYYGEGPATADYGRGVGGRPSGPALPPSQSAGYGGGYGGTGGPQASSNDPYAPLASPSITSQTPPSSALYYEASYRANNSYYADPYAAPPPHSGTGYNGIQADAYGRGSSDLDPGIGPMSSSAQPLMQSQYKERPPSSVSASSSLYHREGGGVGGGFNQSSALDQGYASLPHSSGSNVSQAPIGVPDQFKAPYHSEPTSSYASAYHHSETSYPGTSSGGGGGGSRHFGQAGAAIGGSGRDSQPQVPSSTSSMAAMRGTMRYGVNGGNSGGGGSGGPNYYGGGMPRSNPY